jgi:hypothetical protein
VKDISLKYEEIRIKEIIRRGKERRSNNKPQKIKRKRKKV